MDELESRLSDGLARHAAGVPDYQGDVRLVTRRGRKRRWASRGAGAVGALAILGGGAVIYQAANGGDVVNVATQTPPVVVPTEAPTPTPEPTPEEAIVPDDAATPDPAPTPARETVVRDVFAVAANGWGVGLVGTGGDLFATLTCCDDDGEDWRAQPLSEPARGALRVRDDLRGGLVVSTEDTLWLQPAASFGTDADPIVIDGELLRETNAVRLELWDVALTDDTVSVLYSVSVSDAEGREGWDELRRADIVADSKPVITTIDASRWGPDAPGFVRRGAAWVPGGGHMELRRAIGGDAAECEWVEYVDTDPAFDSPFDPPDPDGDCPQDSIGAAAMNAEGQLAVIERFLAQPPLTAELVIYDRVGNVLFSEPLPETGEDDPRWTELDIVGSSVLVSRAALDAGPGADAVLRFDFDASMSPRELVFVGNPTFARSNLITARLRSLDPTDPRWFGDAASAPEPTPDPEDPGQPEDTADGPDAAPEPGPTTERPPIPPASRVATGRPTEPNKTGLVQGDDGCHLGVCLGAPTADVLAALEALGTPVEIEQPAEGESRFLVDGWDVGIVDRDGVVGTVTLRPASNAATDLAPAFSHDGAPLTLGDLLRKHGPPTSIVVDVDAGRPVLFIEYETTAGRVAYGFADTDPEPSLLADADDERVPEEFDDLVVNVYRAVPAG